MHQALPSALFLKENDMNKIDYDNIASCVRRRGTKTQRKSLKEMQKTKRGKFNMAKKQAIGKSISHWKRMIKWAEKQNGWERVSKFIMWENIHETWFMDYCSLCYEFSCSIIPATCPLCNKYGSCSHRGSGTKVNKWDSVYRARIWGEWVVAAKQLLKQLESLKGSK